MKPSVFFALALALALAGAAAVVIYQFFLPEFVRDGGPLVAVLLTLTLMVAAIAVERALTLRRAAGRGAFSAFAADVLDDVRHGRFAEATARCQDQGGWGAGVVSTGLTHYDQVEAVGTTDGLAEFEEVHRGFEEAAALEAPVLESNLTALSTIASIATMVGLLGTVVGMIRAFSALANAGAPDAVQLSLGISEALINTAGGLVAAILAIVAYNYFTTKIDGLTHQTSAAIAAIARALPLRAPRVVVSGDGATAEPAYVIA